MLAEQRRPNKIISDIPKSPDTWCYPAKHEKVIRIRALDSVIFDKR